MRDIHKTVLNLLFLCFTGLYFHNFFGVGSIIITFFIFYKQPCSQLQISRQGVACTVTVCMKKLSRMEIRTQSRARAVTPDHLDLEPTR